MCESVDPLIDLHDMVAKLKNSVTKLIDQCNDTAEGQATKMKIDEVFSSTARQQTLDRTGRVLSSLKMRILEGLIDRDEQKASAYDLE